jgi:hypothetical protein
MTKWLINEGRADVNEAPRNGLTALIGAVAKGHHALAQWLIEKAGAKMNQPHAAGGKKAWSALRVGLLKGTNTADLAALLKVMVLLDNTPADVIALSPPTPRSPRAAVSSVHSYRRSWSGSGP